jgi:rRNA-processing protein FCF1
MDAFHVVIDTSVLRQAHFRHPDFERLLRRSKKGSLHIYIPHIVLEEQRTYLLASAYTAMDKLNDAFAKIKSQGAFKIFTEGLPEPHLVLWTKAELAQHSRQIFEKFLADHKIEKLAIAERHAENAWARYFEIEPPFNAEEKREDRRKDIPDSWILEAAIDVLEKRGRHCALVNDGRLKDALRAAGFEIFTSVESLDIEIERATAVVNGQAAAQENTGDLLSQLRGPAFKDVDIAILGLNEALDLPTKDTLFEQMGRVGVDREIAEHEARTLVLAGLLTDTGTHYLPTDRALARRAAASDTVIALLMRLV